MIVINYSTCFKALDGYIKAFNSNKESLSEQVRQSAAATAKDIIKIYGLFLAKANGVENLTSDNLPPLRINNVQLAQMANCSTRTIQRHVKRLQQAGIIVNKVWRGTNASYELWINPKILLIRCKKTEREVQNQLDVALRNISDNEHITDHHETNCLHTDSCNKSYKSTNLLKGVDKSNGLEKADTTGNDLIRSSLSLTLDSDKSGNKSSNTLSGYTGEKMQKNFKEAGGKMRKSRPEDQWSGSLKTSNPDSGRSASLNFYVAMLWSLAKNTIYANVYLTERQSEIAQNLLLQWYEPVETNNLSNVHQNYVERMGLVRKFLAKDPEKRFVQLPYKYFDPTNPNGFTGTKKWWKEHQKRKLEVQAKLILHAQIRRFTNNEKKEPSKRKPPLQLFRECETRIGKLGDEGLLQEFHAAVLNPDSYQQVYA